MDNKKNTPMSSSEKIKLNVKADSSMKNKMPDVTFPSRESGMVWCPHCWTYQRTNRDFCYCCLAKFFYLDEQDRMN